MSTQIINTLKPQTSPNPDFPCLLLPLPIAVTRYPLDLHNSSLRSQVLLYFLRLQLTRLLAHPLAHSISHNLRPIPINYLTPSLFSSGILLCKLTIMFATVEGEYKRYDNQNGAEGTNDYG